MKDKRQRKRGNNGKADGWSKILIRERCKDRNKQRKSPNRTKDPQEKKKV